MATTKIFVGSLPEGTTSGDIRALFEAHGAVAECDVIKDYGFVHMTNDADAQAAIEALNGHEFRGVAILVEESRSRVRHQPGMGGRMTCFRCGRQGHWSKECRMGAPTYRESRPGPYSRPSYDRRGGRRSPYVSPYERYDRYGPYERYERLPPGGAAYDTRGVAYDESRYDRASPYEETASPYRRAPRSVYESRSDNYGYEARGKEYSSRGVDYFDRRSPSRERYSRGEGWTNGGGRDREHRRAHETRKVFSDEISSVARQYTSRNRYY